MGKRGEGLGIAGNIAKFNSAEKGEGLGMFILGVGLGCTFGSVGLGISCAGFVIRTEGASIFEGGAGTTEFIRRMLGKRISNGIFTSGGDGTCRIVWLRLSG